MTMTHTSTTTTPETTAAAASPDRTDEVRALARECAREAWTMRTTYSHTDGTESHDAGDGPQVGDWEALRAMLGAAPERADRQTFESAFVAELADCAAEVAS